MPCPKQNPIRENRLPRVGVPQWDLPLRSPLCNVLHEGKGGRLVFKHTQCTCMYVRMYACMHACMYVNILYIYMYMYIYVYVHVYIYIYIYIYIRHTHTSTYMCIFICTLILPMYSGAMALGTPRLDRLERSFTSTVTNTES